MTMKFKLQLTIPRTSTKQITSFSRNHCTQNRPRYWWVEICRLTIATLWTNANHNWNL